MGLILPFAFGGNVAPFPLKKMDDGRFAVAVGVVLTQGDSHHPAADGPNPDGLHLVIN